MIAVGFDFDHTLGVDHSLEVEAYVRFAAELGVTLAMEEEAHHKLGRGRAGPFRAAHLTLDAATEVFVACAPRG